MCHSCTTASTFHFQFYFHFQFCFQFYFHCHFHFQFYFHFHFHFHHWFQGARARVWFSAGLTVCPFPLQVPASWLNNDAGHQWLLPDRFWWQRTAESAWSDVQPADGKDFPLVVGATSHAAVKARCIDARAEVWNAPNKKIKHKNPRRAHLVDFWLPQDEIKAALERLHGERAVAYDNATSTASRASLLSQRRVVCPLWRLARTAADAFSSAVSFYVASEPRAQPPCSNGGRPRSETLFFSSQDPPQTEVHWIAKDSTLIGW